MYSTLFRTSGEAGIGGWNLRGLDDVPIWNERYYLILDNSFLLVSGCTLLLGSVFHSKKNVLGSYSVFTYNLVVLVCLVM